MNDAKTVSFDVEAGVRLSGQALGSGPLVLLLHGFPETLSCWRYQMPALAQAGYRVLAIDMRGYGGSSRPRGVAAYRIDRLVEDLRAVLATADPGSRATVIGHDWGGVVAWCFAMRYPELLERLVILNAPHPRVFARKLWMPGQLRRSWYMFFFQLPWLPERGLERRGLGDFKDALNYYRAAFRWRPQRLTRRIDQPVLVIWGELDRYLGPTLAAPDPRDVLHVREKRLPDATHWLHWQNPDEVNAAILGFLNEG